MEQIQIQKTGNINTIDLYTEAAWNLSYSAFWELYEFSIAEIETARQFISGFISNGNDPYANYLTYCQRVLMAYSFIRNENGKYVPLPSNWFDKKNDKGFSGTIKWMDALNLKRKSVPLHRIELKAMAEAVLEMTEDPSVPNFRYWKSYLIDRKQEWLYFLFVSVVMNGMLTNKYIAQNN
jgi:hypothetical protein